ncbi:DUF4365 domain-containing protein [Amycolatopsis sp. NPDC058986]|uniref:DUF4365 domain-containing protein n=1 Tax=unclassified Amycolatopsis TaxID=2618356 RepID=UPI00366AE54A
MGLDKSEHQGAFGESFIRVLASAAGLTVGQEDIDTRGIDLTLGYKGVLGRWRHPSIQVQVKSWMRRRATHRDGFWKYRMEAKHFNNLAGSDFQMPRFLTLVVVPDDWPDYAVITHERTELRYAAYWVSLLDKPRVDPHQVATVAVDVPVRNLLTVAALRELLAPAESLPVEA